MTQRQRGARGRRRRQHATRKQVVAGVGLSLGAALGMTATAEAADFTVTSLTDDGSGGLTLREAITAADNGGGNDRILFRSGLTGTITLNGTQLPLIDEPLEIVGPGASELAVSGADASRILSVNGAVDLTISDLRLTAGKTASGGGAIYSNNADLIIRGATISQNEQAFAGAIYTDGGAATIENSTISRNTTTSGGPGGILSTGGGPLTVRNSTFSGNTASFAGAVYSLNETATIESSTFSGNRGTSGGPGGILSSGGGMIARGLAQFQEARQSSAFHGRFFGLRDRRACN